MPEVLPVVLVILTIIVAVIGYSIARVSSFKQKQVKIEEALLGIDATLEKCYNAHKKMLDITKNYAKSERETILEDVKLKPNSTVQEKSKAEKQMCLALEKIFPIVEQHPELCSNEQFLITLKAIMDAERQIQDFRRVYNANASSLNKMIVSFPSSVIAKLIGAQKLVFFEVIEEKRKDIDIFALETDVFKTV